jgi:alanyl aminopeptidase
MFESWVGAPEFRRGVHDYLTKYAFGNAAAPEFLDVVSTTTRKNITDAFSTFLNQPGVPAVTFALDCSHGPVLHLAQQRFLPLGSKGSEQQQWKVPVCIRYGTGTQGQSECKLLETPAMDWQLQAKTCPAWIQANDDAVGYYREDYSRDLLNALVAGDVEKRLTAPERVDFMGNAEALTTAGKLEASQALQLVEVFHSDPEHYVVQSAINVALAPRLHLVPDDLWPNYQRFLRKNFQAGARELGWSPKSGDSEDAVQLRPILLRVVATYGGDEELANEALGLTNAWLGNHSAVRSDLVSAVLGTAAFYGGKSLFERFLSELDKTEDRQDRQRIISAMMSFRDPSAIRAGFETLLDGKMSFLEGLPLMFAGQGSEATRGMALDFLEQHYEEIVNKRPTGGGYDAGSTFPDVGRTYCDVQSKQKLQSFLQPRVAQFTGATRALAQVLESIDVCIAERAAEEPSVSAFLQKY